jgi:RNA polymerase-binding transcription factor
VVSPEDRAGVLDTIEADLADVELALARLDAGTYDTCEACGASLADAFLAGAPTVRRCAACG